MVEAGIFIAILLFVAITAQAAPPHEWHYWKSSPALRERPNLRISLATNRDSRDYEDFVRRMIFDLEQTEPMGREDFGAVGSYFAERDGFVALVRDENGKIIGSVGIKRSGPLEDQRAELTRWYLDPDYKGIGLGSTLIRDAIHEARELGYKSVALWVWRKSDKAIAIYERQGFKSHPERDVKDGEYRYFEKAL